ncbi:hypothetical protein PPACK8108_LOCUS11088 [Phakopsora pachyrhizi]|uniref:Phosphoacetylglucosamine mutase n=1 Tax=Phakopsora pachyrhizi TaxID=170000 RepID=A0AAV0B2Z5_PHAPC|nr:hypothetical protein PPACK8108_LOCUS11088 [Phakopsora pachyrhizi]
MDFDLINSLSVKYPAPESGKSHSYGTAGFRSDSNELDRVFFVVGILAGLRSKKLNGKTIGVMITASHNPSEDNGVKLIDPDGEMLESSWEIYATSLSNSKNLSKTVAQTIESESIEIFDDDRIVARVIVGNDTRPSCDRLIEALRDGFSCFLSGNLDFQLTGLKTTPQLHYLVRCLNDGGLYGVPTEQGYYQKLSKAFRQINDGTSNRSKTLIVDCANGVGAPKLELLMPYLKETFLNLELTSTDIRSPQKLNRSCGADYVKSNQTAPESVQTSEFTRGCSFDGDADRIVYYYFNKAIGRFRLMDGDKISSLVASYIKDIFNLESESIRNSFRIGVVQTAYANGNSTRYIEDKLGLPVTCTATGVKHLHHAAQDFDIGVYFEANGHGTVLFSSKLSESLPTDSRLRQLSDLINQTVGDAISDMLLVETILNQKSWSMEDWDEGYEELPNRLVKVLVEDRKRFVTEDAERRLKEPGEIQQKLDQIVKGVKHGRCFVRPSGTEDCVRVYAEAATRELTDELAFRVSGIVFDSYGKGQRPKEFI